MNFQYTKALITWKDGSPVSFTLLTDKDMVICDTTSSDITLVSFSEAYELFSKIRNKYTTDGYLMDI